MPGLGENAYVPAHSLKTEFIPWGGLLLGNVKFLNPTFTKTIVLLYFEQQCNAIEMTSSTEEDRVVSVKTVSAHYRKK